MSESKIENPKNFACFSEFFTRELKSDARPNLPNANQIICSVDGAISQLGSIQQQKLFQAKGKYFPLHSLLAEEEHHSNCQQFKDSQFITMYLAPKDYHRVHMPIEGTLKSTTYVPGKLFSVNDFFVEKIDSIFAKNERFIAYFEGKHGPFAIIMVGAYIVHGIHTVFSQNVNPRRHNSLVKKDYSAANTPITLKQGSEFGFFSLGSTVILLLPKAYKFSDGLVAGKTIQLGQVLGEIFSK